MNRKAKSAIKSITFLFFLVISILAFRFSVVEPYRVPTGSMIPTLMIGDYIFVNKMAYGFRFPFTTFCPFGRSIPKRGDVVVFKFPLDNQINYVKRIIGVPGDKIAITGESVIRNGKVVTTAPYTGKYSEEGYHYRSEGLRNYSVRYDPDMPYRTDFQEITLKENTYFVLGDNRDYSYDSRFWGTVKRDNILGRVELIWFSAKYSEEQKEYQIAEDRLFEKVN